MPDFTLYYVLNGLVNGERGCHALLSGDGEQYQPDGHYFLFDGEADGVGPYDSVDEAREDASAALVERDREQTWLFPTDPGERPFRDESQGASMKADCNFGTVKFAGGGVYDCWIEGSYERLSLQVSAPSHQAAATVFAAAIRAQGEFV